MRYTGEIETKEIEDSLIILPNVGFTETMRVNTYSGTPLEDFLTDTTGWDHHQGEPGFRRIGDQRV